MSTTTNKSKTALILTLDIGTSSTRAMLFDANARPVPDMMVQYPNQLHTTPNGGAEFEPQQLLDTVVQVIDELLEQARGLATRIQGVAIDTFVTNIMGLDSAGQPITPLYTYADIRSTAEADTLRRKFDLDTVHNRTGCRIHPAYLPAQLAWLQHNQPDLFNQVAHWLSFGEYLFLHLFKERQVSYSVASWTGLLNRHTLGWDKEWLDYLSLAEERLSNLVDVDQSLQGLLEPWASRWPILNNIPWFPAIGDGAAANVGSGCVGPQQLALTIGTTGAMRVALNSHIDPVPAGLWLYRINKKYALLGGATTEGGNVFAWLKQTLQLPDNLEDILADRPPAAHGLTILPFVAGERAPGWHAEAKACINGITLNTQPIDILQAGLESVAYRFALVYQRITSHLPPEHQIIASGGLLNSPVWMQIMADVLGRPVVASAEKEATSRGVALLALQSLGITAHIPATMGPTFQPEISRYTKHKAALEAHIKLYDQLIA